MKTRLRIILLTLIYMLAPALSSATVLAQQSVDATPVDDNATETATSKVIETYTVEAVDPAVEPLVEEPVFDIDVLIERVKETDAVGVFTKLSLKNQIDDLLEHAAEVNQSPAPENVEKLRNEFEGLLLKTVTLLNNGEDYTLAEDIYLAREQLWKSIMENKA